MSTDPTPADFFAKTVDVSFRKSLLLKIADRNPFYLISAACMLGGCLAMTNSLSWTSLPLRRLLLLIGTLNVYEGALIALAILLMKRGLLRDSRILLIVEAFFLVDLTFLNTEVVTSSLRVGLMINIVLFVLTILKLRFISRALGNVVSTATAVFVVAMVFALFAIPCVLRNIDHGTVSPINFYAIWWIVGLMPAVREVALRIWPEQQPVVMTGPARVYVALPWISLITHLGILHYVYDVSFYGAMATPVLLGLTLVLNRVAPTKLVPRSELNMVRFLLPIAAVMVSLNCPHVLTVYIFHCSITTALLALAGTYLTFVYIYFLPYAVSFLAIGLLLVSARLFGPSVDQIEQFAWRIWTFVVEITNWMVPSTVAGWGVISVLASFFFLAVGAAISFARPRLLTIEQPNIDVS